MAEPIYLQGYVARVAASTFSGETFRVLKEKEIRQFGEYCTRRLVLEAWEKLVTTTSKLPVIVIAKDPNLAQAYNNPSLLLDDLGRAAEAEDAYRQAIALYEQVNDLPHHAAAYNNLGVVLDDLCRAAEAEDAYRQAIALYGQVNNLPHHAAAYTNLGNLLAEQGRAAEAEDAYRQAIALYGQVNDLPHQAAAYNNLSNLLRTSGRAKEALPLLETLAEITPEDFAPWLGMASVRKALGESAPPEFIEKARQFLPEDDFYNRACLESVCGNLDSAFEYLEKAAQTKKFDPQWARRDPDLEWLRADPRFETFLRRFPPAAA